MLGMFLPVLATFVQDMLAASGNDSIFLALLFLIRDSYLWQDKIYKKVYAEAMAFSWTLGRPAQLLKRPEANGVNLFSTSRLNGGPLLESNPQQRLYLMAILGAI